MLPELATESLARSRQGLGSRGLWPARGRNRQTKADDMNHNIILHISDLANSCNSALAALKEAGSEIVSTNSPTEGVALLYIMYSVAAVVSTSRREDTPTLM